MGKTGHLGSRGREEILYSNKRLSRSLYLNNPLAQVKVRSDEFYGTFKAKRAASTFRISIFSRAWPLFVFPLRKWLVNISNQAVVHQHFKGHWLESLLYFFAAD